MLLRLQLPEDLLRLLLQAGEGLRLLLGRRGLLLRFLLRLMLLEQEVVQLCLLLLLRRLLGLLRLLRLQLQEMVQLCLLLLRARLVLVLVHVRSHARQDGRGQHGRGQQPARRWELAEDGARQLGRGGVRPRGGLVPAAPRREAAGALRRGGALLAKAEVREAAPEAGYPVGRVAVHAEHRPQVGRGRERLLDVSCQRSRPPRYAHRAEQTPDPERPEWRVGFLRLVGADAPRSEPRAASGSAWSLAPLRFGARLQTRRQTRRQTSRPGCRRRQPAARKVLGRDRVQTGRGGGLWRRHPGGAGRGRRVRASRPGAGLLGRHGPLHPEITRRATAARRG